MENSHPSPTKQFLLKMIFGLVQLTEAFRVMNTVDCWDSRVYITRLKIFCGLPNSYQQLEHDLIPIAAHLNKKMQKRQR